MTFVRFRKALVTQALDKALFDEITAQLKAKAIRVKTGTLVDATVIASASQEDGEARWVKHKGRAAVHGFKAHVGVDANTALVEEVAVTPANVNDGKAGPDALPDAPGEVFADSAYRRRAARRRSRSWTLGARTGWPVSLTPECRRIPALRRRDAVGQLFEPSHALAATFGNDVRGAVSKREFLTRLMATHGDDPPCLHLLCRKHAHKADRAITDHHDGRTRLHLGSSSRVPACAEHIRGREQPRCATGASI
jgi:hypothetical protein